LFDLGGVQWNYYGRIHGGTPLNCKQKETVRNSPYTTPTTKPTAVQTSRGETNHRDVSHNIEAQETSPSPFEALDHFGPTQTSDQPRPQRNILPANASPSAPFAEIGTIHLRNATCLIVQASNQSAERVPSSDWYGNENENQLIITERHEYANNSASQLLQWSQIPPK